MTELSAADCGRIIAALEAFATEHPDPVEEEAYAALADRIAECRVILECDED